VNITNNSIIGIIVAMQNRIPFILVCIVLNVALFLTPTLSNAQTKRLPVANFSFDQKKINDEVNGIEAQLVGASFTIDRFGNENNAVYLFGNQFSYINLSRDKRLQSEKGSVSFWVKLESEVFSGSGYKCNPLIVAKRTKDSNFFESYGVYYMLNTQKVAVNCARDSIRQIGVTSIKKFKLFRWHHIAFTYDDRFLAFYVDGKLENKITKDFKTYFLEDEAILVGVSGNKKNNRFSQGAFDDFLFFDSVLSEEEILELYHAPNPNKNKILLNNILIIFVCIVAMALLTLIIRYGVNIHLQREKQRLEVANKLLENELRINRALMNPHFIFNSLNTLHSFILKNHVDKASDFLLKFSRLIRKILESNMSDTISLDLEIELIERYLEIESLRFKENFNYKVLLEDGISPSKITIPIMMLQPFVENSVWHGLRDKEGEKNIFITISRTTTNYLLCIVEDNGTGRKIKNTDNSEKKSLATGFVSQRLAFINKIYDLQCSMEIIDKPEGAGTIVKLLLPILNM